MIGATVLRALVLAAAFSAGLTPVTCLGENSNGLPTKATKELPPELLSLLRQKKMPKYSPIVVRVFKEEAELEIWKQDTTGPRSSRSIQSVGGRAILGRSCRRATVRLQRGSIQLHPS
jgi:murein L,D-transpeptidase YafK